MKTATYYSRFLSPIGELLLVSDGVAITGLTMHQHWDDVRIQPDWIATEEPFVDVKSQLTEYFAGERHEFTVPVNLMGTAFQLQAWEQLKSIPYGETIAPRGTRLEVISRNAQTLTVRYLGQEVVVPLQSTDAH